MRFFDPVYITAIILVLFISIYEFILLRKYKMQMNRQDMIRSKLLETSEIISKTNNEDKIYSIVLDVTVELIPNATNGSVLLIDDKGDFHYQVVKGFQKELETFTLKREEAYLYKLNEFKETAIINNPREFDCIHTNKETIEGLQRINALDISCTISAPIYIDNKFTGLLNVDTNKPNYIFTEKDVELLNQIKCELELAIKNALAQNKLKYLADYDELTGVNNRRSLKKHFDFEVEQIKKTTDSLCLVMIDVDNFKYINDTYGHYFGDMALKHLSILLNNAVRKTDVVARFAGDEFIILFKDCNLATAESRMKAITDVVSLAQLDGILLKFSYGICEIGPNDNLNFDKALAKADIKMYEHKRFANYA